ncbi:MAG: methylase, partial [Defluviicoccus sp.]|nr:methylase [Defluviicoccus sp.]
MPDASPAPAAAPAPQPALAFERGPDADALSAAARELLPVLEAGRPLDADLLRDVMTRAAGGSDVVGYWSWKDAYEAAETAVAMFMLRYGTAMRRRAGAGRDGPAAMLAMIEKIAALEPSQTRRSEDQLRLQQFSTPLPLAYAALQAARVGAGDTVLEPSAGTGMLAVMARLALGDEAAGRLHLNEIARTRAGLLVRLFPDAAVTALDAETIADRLAGVRPTVALMNPPFSITPGIDARRAGADLAHIRSAASMLPEGGRLVAISSSNCHPSSRHWSDTFAALDPPARAVFTTAIDGRAYARRGTGFETRLTVLDRTAETDHRPIGDVPEKVADAAGLLAAIAAAVPARLPVSWPQGPDLFGRAPKPASAPRPAARP